MQKNTYVTGEHRSKVDVAVLLLFFTRTEQTVRTFEQIRKARPARLTYIKMDLV